MLSYIQTRRAVQKTNPTSNTRRSKLDRVIPSDYPIESFAELHALVVEVNDSDSELGKARHLAYLLECLAEFEQLVDSGKLGCHRIGNGRGAIRIRPEDVDTYLRTCRSGAVSTELPRCPSQIGEPVKSSQ